MSHSNHQPRIAVIGAGPAGILTAWYLKKQGYRNVFVLEKSGRVGGLAHSHTWDGRSFDLGANYVTPAYTEILRLGREVGATTYAERPFIAMRLPEEETGRVKLESILTAMRTRDDGSKVGLLTFAWLNLVYIYKRFKLRKVLDRPTFEGVAQHADLCLTMEEWLDKNELGELKRLFQLPVNLMGFGTVKTTPALYPLKFMTLKTFIPMLIKETPFIGRFSSWPRRFTDGFQRLFDRLSWQLNVRLNIDVQQITRSAEGVQINYRKPEQILDGVRWEDGTLNVDHLILACPLTADVVDKFLDITPDSKEGELLSKIHSLSYCMTTCHTEGGDLDGDPLAGAYPEPEMGYLPWGVAKQWLDSDFTQFYTRVDSEEGDVQQQVEDGAAALVKMMGGRIKDNEDNWQTYTRWPYFQHVDGEAIRDGWYDKLQAQQGVNRTFYVGGATNFELIEPIAEYAKHLVATHFPTQR